MIKWFRKKKKLSEEEEERLENEWYEKKSELMQIILGKEHDIVSHALIPYELGGGLDLYYYPNGIKGTGIATKELTYACRNSSKNSIYSKYEIVMFTEHKIDLEGSREEVSPFGVDQRNINAILNCIALYSAQAELNPGETCEFPKDMDTVGGKCLIFDNYESVPDLSENNEFGVMLIMEIFRDEMEFAMDNGGQALLSKLKDKGIYPYSNLNRPSALSEQA